MAAKPTTLLDLPVDILLLIFPHLDAPSFLSLTSTCSALHVSDFLHEPSFWSNITRTTFRVPNQPVVENDGQRWQKLYKRLLTQSRIYTWGNNEKACLGHSFEQPVMPRRVGPLRRGPIRMSRPNHISWPEQMQGTENLGIVSDLQCGGWSTSLLTSEGAVYTVGVLDGLQFNIRQAPGRQRAHTQPTPLRYPPGFVQPHERYDPATAARQFSAGRSHLLALSDSGWIWSWQDIDHAALRVRFLHHNTAEGGSQGGRGVVKKVVAGWNKSAALIEGTGIVVWEPLRREENEAENEDAALVLESVLVPMTSHRKADGPRQAAFNEARLGETVGEVQNFIVLENVVLFNTSLGKVFTSQMIWHDDEQRVSEPIELHWTDEAASDDAHFATDVQGSFHNFAVFTRSGEVLTSNQDRLMSLLNNTQRDSEELFTRIPALQHRDVISVAFGDYHFHALHAPGHITSYGNEPQACGALGLGGNGNPEGRLRGIRFQAMGGDGRLVPHAYTEGRRVWFEREKRVWIQFLTSGGVDPGEAQERMRMAIGSPDINGQGEVSEWVEQEGRDWEGKFGLRGTNGDDQLGAYFALSVTAAGWHSGALMLVNEELVNRISKACEVDDEPSSGADDKPETADEDEREDEPSQHEAGGASLLTGVVNTARDYGRWFLGLPHDNADTTHGHHASRQHTGSEVPLRPHAGAPLQHPQTAARNGPQPSDYGASPRHGVRYVWANDQFPRLRLSNGTEMPGSGPLNEWRYGRPEWDLDFRL